MLNVQWIGVRPPEFWRKYAKDWRMYGLVFKQTLGENYHRKFTECRTP
jgi:hypothetical protein